MVGLVVVVGRAREREPWEDCDWSVATSEADMAPAL